MKIDQLGKISLGMILILLLSTSCASTSYTSVDSQRKSLMLKEKPDYTAKKSRRKRLKSQRKSLMLPEHPRRKARKMKKRMKTRKR